MSENVITINTIVDKVEYRPRPGLGYEVAEGITAKMLRHTPARVEQVENILEEMSSRIDKKEVHVLDMVVAQAKVVASVPEHFKWDREHVDSTVCQQLVRDFFGLAYLRAGQVSGSLIQPGQDTESRPSTVTNPVGS